MLVLPHRFILWKLSTWCRFEICICPTSFFSFLFSVREHWPVISNAVNRLDLCSVLLYDGFCLLHLWQWELGLKDMHFMAQLLSCRVFQPGGPWLQAVAHGRVAWFELSGLCLTRGSPLVCFNAWRTMWESCCDLHLKLRLEKSNWVDEKIRWVFWHVPCISFCNIFFTWIVFCDLCHGAARGCWLPGAGMWGAAGAFWG